MDPTPWRRGPRLESEAGDPLRAGTLSSPVRAQGRLAKSPLGTDSPGIARTGAKVEFAVVAAGLSLVAESVYGHIKRRQLACERALACYIEVTPSERRVQNTSEEN